MATTRYHDEEVEGSVHIPHNFTYANQAARKGATGLTTDDIGKLAKQTDDGSFWICTQVSPSVAWASYTPPSPVVGDIAKLPFVRSDGASDVRILWSIPNHNSDLTGLQGGTGSEYYHLTSAQHGGLTGGSDASAYHDHTSIYYTQTEVGVLIATHAATTVTHGATGAIVGTTNTQTISNKTYVTPTIASFANATHSHLNAAGGGLLTPTAAGLSNVTNDAQLKRSANDFLGFGLKSPLVAGDHFLLEDSTSLWFKKYTTLADILFPVNDILQVGMEQPTGFPNRTDSTLSYVSGTRTITLTAAVTTFDHYRKGIKYSLGTPQVRTHPDVTGTYYFYWDSAGILQYSTTPYNILTDVLIARTYYNATKGIGITFEERHGSQRNPEAHFQFHFNVGAYWTSSDGLGISSYTLQPGTPADADNQFAIAAGIVRDEDIPNAITGRTSGTYKIFQRTGATGVYTWDDNNVPILSGGSYLYWNEFTGGAWQTTASSNNKYINHYVIAVGAIDADYDVVVLMGQAEHSSLADAEAETIADIDFGTIITEEILAIYKITFRTGAAYSTEGKCRIEAVEDTRRTTSRQFLSAQPPANHNSLGGLQGGAAGEYYHLTAAQHTSLTGAGDSALHYHSTDRDRANHTGTQAASTISDFDVEVANNTDVAANTTHRGLTNNPHTVTAAQVGNTTAQWNANKLQGYDISSAAPGAGYQSVYDTENSEWRAEPVGVGLYHGFENFTDSTLSMTDGTQTFNLTTTGFFYWVKGVRKYFATTDTADIGDVSRKSWIYIDGSTGNLEAATSYSDDLIIDHVLVATVTYDAGGNETIALCDCRCKHNGEDRMSIMCKWRKERMRGTQWAGGLALTGIVADGDGSSDTHAQCGYAAGSIVWCGREWTISAVTTPAQIPVYYRTGTGSEWQRYAATDFPMRQYIGGSANRLSYNNFNGTTWSEGLTLANNYVVSLPLFATNDPNNPVIAVHGRSQNARFISADLQHGDVALQDALSVVNDPTFPFDIAIPIGVLIPQTNTTYTNAVNARVISLQGSDYADLRYFGSRQEYYAGKIEWLTTTSTSVVTYKETYVDNMEPGFYRISASYIWHYGDSGSRVSETDAGIVTVFADSNTLSSAFLRSAYYGWDVEYPQQSAECKYYCSAGTHRFRLVVSNFGAGGYATAVQQGRIMIERII